DGEEISIEDLGVTVKKIGTSIAISSDSVKVNYNPEKKADGQREFYDRIEASLSSGNHKLLDVLNSSNENG
ncbi:hypothetical protein KKD03_00660, partial [Patescibacteria group bacterium]|nr:hypothetical protein [Patescibacteria group bacterium]